MRQTNGGGGRSNTLVAEGPWDPSLDDLVRVGAPTIKRKQWAAFKRAMLHIGETGRAMTMLEVVEHCSLDGVKISESKVRALALILVHQEAARMHFEVFHSCSDAPLLCRDFTQGFQPVPWICAGCGEHVSHRDDLSYIDRVTWPAAGGNAERLRRLEQQQSLFRRIVGGCAEALEDMYKVNAYTEDRVQFVAVQLRKLLEENPPE